MKQRQFAFTYLVYNNIEEMPDEEKALLKEARSAIQKSYAPYSHFRVGAAAKLNNGAIISGANQENAAYPICLCAERVVLATAASNFPDMPLSSMAISYSAAGQQSNHPISPCGMCRQALQEAETRMNNTIKLILGGTEGPVYVIESASQLLPLAFTSEELK